MSGITTYKHSIFNEEVTIGAYKYLWNTSSGALIKMSPENYNYYLHNINEDDGSNDFKTLLSNGLIVKSSIDELGQLLLNEKTAMYDRKPKTHSYVIALGLDCNYKCTYCFENGRDHTAKMSLETATDVAKFICSEADNNPCLDTIKITWFGGEPLLHVDTINHISEIVMDYAQTKKIKYQAGMITNGSLLNDVNVDQLKKINVRNLQITIDGVGEDYCISKGTTKTNFEKVINNICKYCDFFRISVRLNIPGNDYSKAISTTKYLFSDCNLSKKIGISLGFVRDYLNGDDASDYRKHAISYSKWLDFIVETYGMDVARKLHTPKSRPTSCGLLRSNNFCIGVDGSLYKCEHCFGENEYSVGNIYDGKAHNYIEQQYMTTTSEQKCIDCKLLPICLSGCTNDKIRGTEAKDCDAFKRLSIKQKMIEGGENIDSFIGTTLN